MGRCLSTSSILAAAVALMSSVASAETSTKPSSGPASAGDRPQVVSPYWNPSDASAPAATAETLLTQTVMAVPQARADAVVAKWTYRRLGHELTRSSNQMRSDFFDSEEYTNAVNELKAAYAALETARSDALRGLQDTAEYQASVSLRRDVSEQIADAHDTRQPDLDRILALAELKLDYVTPIRAAERDLVGNNDAVRRAKERLITAAANVARLEKEFARGVRDSIELSEIRKSHDDARIAMLASSAYLDETRVARSIAINYAGLTQGVGRYRPRYGYGGSGYCGGYYYPGTVGFGLGGVSVGGVISTGGNAGFGRGSNAFFGRGGNAIIGPGPSSATQAGQLR